MGQVIQIIKELEFNTILKSDSFVWSEYTLVKNFKRLKLCLPKAMNINTQLKVEISVNVGQRRLCKLLYLLDCLASVSFLVSFGWMVKSFIYSPDRQPNGRNNSASE